MKWTISLVLAASLPLALTACGGSSSGDGAADGKLQIAAAFYPLQYAAQRVAGDHADVENLTQPGQEPHDIELTVRETALIADADLVVFEESMSHAVEDGIEATGTGDTLDAASVVHLEKATEDEGEEHAEEEDEHGDLDPHFWQDPERMADLGDALADKLAELDPANADDYTANAAALRTDLEALDQEYADGLADCERHTIVVSHDAYSYLAKYGLELAPIAGLSPDAEPTPADLAHLQDLIEQDGITTVFGETLVSPKLSETLADDMGIATAVLDPIEGLTDQTADQDYLSLMRSNLAALQQANGC